MPRQSQRAKEKKAKKADVDAVNDKDPNQEIPASMRKMSATRGLQEALALQYHSDVYGEMRRTMRNLADKIFDFELGATRQSEEQWKRFQDELYEIYPRFKRRPQAQVIFFLQRYGKQYISVRRWRDRKQIRQNDVTDNKENIIAKSNATSEQSKSTPISNTPCQSMSSQIQNSNDTTANSRTALSCPPAYKDAPLDFSQLLSESPSLFSLPILQEFLGGCHPPLPHLLRSFMEIGFRTDRMFEEVLTWPMYELVAALDKWHALGYITPLDRETLRINLVQKQKQNVSFHTICGDK